MIIAIWAAVGLFGGFTGHAGAAAVGAASPFTWEAAAGFRSSPLKVPQGGRTGLQRMPNTDLGIQFTNTLAIEAAKTNNNLMNGAGVAAGDFDGDGWCDLYFCNLGGQNVLYRNLGGWKFADVTTSAGATLPPMASTGAVFADLDGDGWLDLVVTACGGPNAVLMNDGHGKFQLRTTEAGLVSDRGGTSMALADIDGDGDLDLYVANYANLSILRSGGAINIRMIDGKPTVIGPCLLYTSPSPRD